MSNFVVATKEVLIMRDTKIDQEGTDSRNRGTCWSNLAVMFNDVDNQEVNCNWQSEVNEFDRITFNYSGFIGTSTFLRKKCSELRGELNAV